MWGSAHRVGRTTGGLTVFEAHRELTDVADHVISAGELFTRLHSATADKPKGTPVCAECLPFVMEGGAA